jgi:hypothetical protein
MQEVDWTRPTAFVVGNEREGVTQAAIDLSDAVVSIPMTGDSADRVRQWGSIGGSRTKYSWACQPHDKNADKRQ